MFSTIYVVAMVNGVLPSEPFMWCGSSPPIGPSDPGPIGNYKHTCQDSIYTVIKT